MRELRFDLPAGFHQILRETAPSVALAMRTAAGASYHGFAGHPGTVDRVRLRPAAACLRYRFTPP
jgi:hypothetical protein